MGEEKHTLLIDIYQVGKFCFQITETQSKQAGIVKEKKKKKTASEQLKQGIIWKYSLPNSVYVLLPRYIGYHTD